MQFTVEQISVMRQPGLHTSNQTDAPAPALYSRGAVRDFRTKGSKAMYWNFVDQYAHLPQLREYVRCICCNAKPNKDGNSRPRRVYGLHSSKLVSAQKYRHPNCPAAGGKDVTYDAKHPDVMARLPAFLAAQLSITFTHSGAMDDEMLQHIHHDVMKGLSFQAACDRAASFLRRNHNQAELDRNQQQSPVVAVAPASAAAAYVPQQQSPVMAVAPAAAAATSAPQQQSPVVAAIPAAAAATSALQQQYSVVPATPGAEAVVAAASNAPQEQSGTGQQHLLATRKAKAKAAPKPLSAASKFLAAASASLHQPARRVPASLTVSLTGDLCQVTLQITKCIWWIL